MEHNLLFEIFLWDVQLLIYESLKIGKAFVGMLGRDKLLYHFLVFDQSVYGLLPNYWIYFLTYVFNLSLNILIVSIEVLFQSNTIWALWKSLLFEPPEH